MEKPEKTWTYGPFTVEAYLCSCGTTLREYSKKGKKSFALKRKVGRRYTRV